MSFTQAYQSDRGEWRKSSPKPYIVPAIVFLFYCCVAVMAIQHPPVDDGTDASAATPAFFGP